MIIFTTGTGKKFAIESYDIIYIAENETDTTVQTDKDIFHVKEDVESIVRKLKKSNVSTFAVSLWSALVGFVIATVLFFAMLDNSPMILD